MSGRTGWTRPDTQPVIEERLGRTITTRKIKRCCNGCGRELGDVNDDEILDAVLGTPIPDVRIECGCWSTPEVERLIDERDQARDLAVRLEQENYALRGFFGQALRLAEYYGKSLIELDYDYRCRIIEIDGNGEPIPVPTVDYPVIDPQWTWREQEPTT